MKNVITMIRLFKLAIIADAHSNANVSGRRSRLLRVYNPEKNAVRSLGELRSWQRRGGEAPIEPEMPIIDPHHHLWPGPREPYLPADFVEDIAGGHRIVASVHIECGSRYRRTGAVAMKPVGETEFVVGETEKVTAGRSLCGGIVARADMCLGDQVVPVLEAQAVAAKGRLRGIRHPLRWDEAGIGHFGRQFSPALALDPGFRAGFAHLARLGLTFDAWAFHHQIKEVTSLARAFPATTLIINHLGGPLGVGAYTGRRQEIFSQWRRDIAELALNPNVIMKLSGIGMLYFGFDFYKRDVPPGSKELASVWRPYIDVCLNAFGTTRCMFASNYPVDKQTCSYTTLWNSFKLLTQSMTAHERSQLFKTNAEKTYRLAGNPSSPA